MQESQRLLQLQQQPVTAQGEQRLAVSTVEHQQQKKQACQHHPTRLTQSLSLQPQGQGGVKGTQSPSGSWVRWAGSLADVTSSQNARKRLPAAEWLETPALQQQGQGQGSAGGTRSRPVFWVRYAGSLADVIAQNARKRLPVAEQLETPALQPQHY